MDMSTFMDGCGWTSANAFPKMFFKKCVKFRGPIEMDRDGCAWMDMDGRRHMHFQKLQKGKLNGPLGPLSFLFCDF